MTQAVGERLTVGYDPGPAHPVRWGDPEQRWAVVVPSLRHWMDYYTAAQRAITVTIVHEVTSWPIWTIFKFILLRAPRHWFPRHLSLFRLIVGLFRVEQEQIGRHKAFC
jgi:hypothetical protein